MRNGRLAFLMVLVLLLGAVPVLAIHAPGKGSYVSVATDGYDNGYYLVVWSNSSGVFGKLYYIRNNLPASDVLNIYTTQGASLTVVASMKIDSTQSSDNEYLVVWKASDGYPYARLLDYKGSPLTGAIQLDSENKTDYLGVTYGSGHFVVVYEGGVRGTYQNLYYSIIDTNGSVVDHGMLYQFDGAIHYSKSITYDPVSGYFGVFLRNKDSSGNYDATFLDFKLNSEGKLDKGTVHLLQVLNDTKIYGTAIAPAQNGFVIAYETGYKWYTYRVDLSNGNPSLATNSSNGPYYKGYRASGGASMDFVENGTGDYIVFAYEDRESSSGNYEIVVEKLNLDGVPLDGDGSGDHVISETGKSYRYPSIVAKPAHSPAAYIVAWSDTTDGTVLGSEYLPDFTEVSETNQVPFFGNLLVVVLALGLILLRRH